MEDEHEEQLEVVFQQLKELGDDAEERRARPLVSLLQAQLVELARELRRRPRDGELQQQQQSSLENQPLGEQEAKERVKRIREFATAAGHQDRAGGVIYELASTASSLFPESAAEDAEALLGIPQWRSAGLVEAVSQMQGLRDEQQTAFLVKAEECIRGSALKRDSAAMQKLAAILLRIARRQVINGWVEREKSALGSMLSASASVLSASVSVLPTSRSIVSASGLSSGGERQRLGKWLRLWQRLCKALQRLAGDAAVPQYALEMAIRHHSQLAAAILAMPLSSTASLVPDVSCALCQAALQVDAKSSPRVPDRSLWVDHLERCILPPFLAKTPQHLFLVENWDERLCHCQRCRRRLPPEMASWLARRQAPNDRLSSSSLQSSAPPFPAPVEDHHLELTPADDFQLLLLVAANREELKVDVFRVFAKHRQLFLRCWEALCRNPSLQARGDLLLEAALFLADVCKQHVGTFEVLFETCPDRKLRSSVLSVLLTRSSRQPEFIQPLLAISERCLPVLLEYSSQIADSLWFVLEFPPSVSLPLLCALFPLARVSRDFFDACIMALQKLLVHPPRIPVACQLLARLAALSTPDGRHTPESLEIHRLLTRPYLFRLPLPVRRVVFASLLPLVSRAPFDQLEDIVIQQSAQFLSTSASESLAWHPVSNHTHVKFAPPEFIQLLWSLHTPASLAIHRSIFASLLRRDPNLCPDAPAASACLSAFNCPSLLLDGDDDDVGEAHDGKVMRQYLTLAATLKCSIPSPMAALLLPVALGSGEVVQLSYLLPFVDSFRDLEALFLTDGRPSEDTVLLPLLSALLEFEGAELDSLGSALCSRFQEQFAGGRLSAATLRAYCKVFQALSDQALVAEQMRRLLGAFDISSPEALRSILTCYVRACSIVATPASLDKLWLQMLNCATFDNSNSSLNSDDSTSHALILSHPKAIPVVFRMLLRQASEYRVSVEVQKQVLLRFVGLTVQWEPAMLSGADQAICQLAASLSPEQRLVVRRWIKLHALRGQSTTDFARAVAKLDRCELKDGVLDTVPEASSDPSQPLSHTSKRARSGILSRRTRIKIRSRNAWIDEALGQLPGTVDTYADLEDFIVPE